MKLFKRWLVAELILALAVPSGAGLTGTIAQAAEGESSGSSDFLGNIKAGLDGVNNTMGQVAGTQAQMQQMINMASAMRLSNQRMTQNMGAIQAIAGQLAMAFSEAQQCQQKAAAQGAQKKVGKQTNAEIAKTLAIPPSEIDKVEPTCANYEEILKTGKFAIDHLNQANTELSCVKQLQEKVNQIAESAKTPFTQLTQAANENWNVRKQVIEHYESTAKKIDKDLNGADGYKAKLEGLKKISSMLTNALNASGKGTRAANVDGVTLELGLARRIEDLDKKRKKVANDWHSSIINQSLQCFYQDSAQPCDAAGNAMTPIQCAQAYVNRDTGGRAGVAATNVRNRQELDRHLRLMGQHFKELRPGDVTVTDMKGFLEFSRTSFEKVSQKMAQTMKGANFVAPVKASDVATFLNSKMKECYNNSMRSFESSLKSKDTAENSYYGRYNAIIEEEKDLDNAVNNWVNVVTEKMNDFRTAFTKIYQSDLPQFAQNCEAAGNPQESLKCLRHAAQILRDGINGTGREGIITMSVPVMQTDAQGMPTAGTSSMQCRGFNECLTTLERTKEHNERQAQSQTQEREKFVQNHNKTLETSMGAVGAQFSAMGQMIQQAVAAMNGQLSLLGISGLLKTKQLKGEELEKDEKTGLLKAPTNMKSAFAGKGSITEIDDLPKAAEGIAKRRTEVGKKLQAAQATQSKCTVSYSELKGALGNCKRMCSDGTLKEIFTKAERAFVASKTEPEKISTSLGSEFRSCLRDAQQDARVERLEATARAGQIRDEERARRETDRALDEAKDKRKEEQAGCVSSAVSQLRSHAEGSRSKELKERNEAIATSLENIAGSCMDGKPEEAESVCTDLKGNLEDLLKKSGKKGGGDNPFRGDSESAE